ncbi:TonB-dependent receptor [Phenylobacterium sp.]|jgi:iron complex outermembrane receptor protein|uniref:TonB-dependent receptor n=1 Tax=Phenylobacterium sp. TaxID=1871053 RepID=UPI002F41150D
MTNRRRDSNFVSRVIAGVLMASAGGTSVAVAADAPGTLQEIIVTAQKREEKLQEVPVSISVISGLKTQEMGISDLRVLQGYVPSMAILNSGVNPIVYIRGFGSGPNNVAFDQEVSIYLDGIYGGRAPQFTAPFFDLDRMEVLRGPQGALFGRNTAAGAISLVSAKPTWTPEASATAGYNISRQGFEGSGYVSGPLSDTVAARLAVKYTDEDGYLKNLATGDRDPHLKDQLVRLSLAWRPNQDFDLTTKLEYGKHEFDGGVTKSGFLTQSTDFNDVRYVSEPYGPSPEPENSGIESYNAAVTADYRLGDFTLTSVSGYSEFTTTRLSAYDELNPDGSIQPNGGNALYANGFPEYQTQWSEELRLLSPTGKRLEYVAGIYVDTAVYKLHQDTFYRLLGGGTITGSQATDFRQNSDTYSVFGQGTFHATDAIRLVGGLRYSHTSKDATFSSKTVSGVALNPIVPGIAGSLSEHYLDPSATLQFDAAKGVMLYATFAQGSKSGGFVSNTYGMTVDRFQFKPEQSRNYEVGVKSTLLDGRMTANLSIFDTKFTNLQQSSYDPDRRTFITRNAASAEAKGAEADVQWLVIDPLELSLGLSYLDAKFTNFPGAACLAYETLAQCNSADPASLAAHNIAGLPLQYAPKWSGNLGARYTLETGNGYRIVSNLNALFRSSYFIADGYSPIWGVQDGWVKLDARIQAGPDNDRWHVALVGRNLTDQKTVGNAIRFPASITTTTRSINWMDEYRSVVVEGTYRFF